MKSTFRKGRENRVYKILLLSATVLFAVFFTSKLWMYDDNPVAQTPFNKEIAGLEKTKIKLSKWEYNPEKELMEVTIEIEDNGEDMVKPSFSFEAEERDSKEEYPANIVYQDDNNIVVQLLEVPENFKVVGLFMIEHRDKKILEMELKEELKKSESFDQDGDDKGEVDLSMIKPAEQVIVGDYRRIKINNDLSTKSEIDYKIQNLQREIDMIVKEMEEVSTEKIPHQDELVAHIEEDIEGIKEGMQFETDEEKEESKAKIESKKQDIEEAIKEKEALKLVLENLSSKRGKLIEKLGAVVKESNEEQEKASEEEEEKESEVNKEDDEVSKKDKKEENEKPEGKKQKDEKKKSEKKKGKD